MDEDVIQKVHDLYQKVHEANMELQATWSDHILFTWQWWLSLAMVIIPWTTWFIFHKKESRARLLLAGLVVILISSILDFIGITYGMWVYNVNVLFTIPASILCNFSVLPITIMFFLQIKPHINSLSKAIAFSIFTSFIGEPLTVWLGLYDPLEWKYIYSFPIYIVIYLIAHYTSRSENFKELL